MKYYKVIYTIHTINPGGPSEREVLEYMTAREGSDIIDTCKRRWGKYLIEVQYKEISERSVPKGTNVYVAI